jgi:RNA polymerase sigma factor (sigma-70 family)
MAMTQSVSELLSAAAAGSPGAWDGLVVRYAPLVVSVAGRYRLAESDVADVCQTVWLRLIERMSSLRDPEALPGWLATTTRREALRVLSHAKRTSPIDVNATFDLAEDDEATAPDRRLLEAEREQALRDAFTELPDHCRRLLAALGADPPPSYEEISLNLSMPIGSIGPTRSRCLSHLRRCPAIAALHQTESNVAMRGR